MNRMAFKNIIIFTLFLFCIFGLSGPAFPAPYGPGSRATTIYDRLLESDLVIYGRIKQKVKGKDKNDPGLTEVEIQDVIKGRDWKQGDFFHINRYLKAKKDVAGVFYLVKSYSSGQGYFEYSAFYPDSEREILEYSRQINSFMKKKNTLNRLVWVFSRVNSSNGMIAWDAFTQLGSADYYTLKKASRRMSGDSLRYMAVLPGQTKQGENRKSFYVFLLGLKGDSDHRDFVRRIADNPANRDSEILYGAMMACGLLFSDHPTYFYRRATKGATETVKLAILEADLNLMKYEKPARPEALLKSYYYILNNSSGKVLIKAFAVASELKLNGPLKYARSLYIRNSGNRDVKIAIITYLRFIRKNPQAVRLMAELKAMEKDRKVRNHFE